MAAGVQLLSAFFIIGLFLPEFFVCGERNLRFSVEPSDQVVGRIRAARLECASAYPGAQISWLNGTLTSGLRPVSLNDSRYRVEKNGSLVFKKIKGNARGATSLNGVYSCLLKTSEGSLLSRPARLQVANLSEEFSESPKNTSVNEGDLVRLSCQISSIPSAGIRWEKDNVSLPQNSRFTVLQSGVLYINNTQVSDSGEYRCVAQNPELKKIRASSSGLLTVVRADPTSSSTSKSLEFLSPSPAPSPLYIMQRVSQQLECAASAHPLVPQLIWTSEFGEVISESFGVSILDLSSVISDVPQNFSCKAFLPNKASEIITQTTEVNVIIPPTITIRPVSQESPASKTIKFQCAASGSPEPKIIWLKDGELLKINGRIQQKGTELTLSSTIASDSGIYQCFASNVESSVWSAAQLVISNGHNLHSPPSRLNCKTLNNSSIQITWWQAAEYNIQAYTIHYAPTDGGDELREVTMEKMYTINKLKPFTNYTVYVRSYTNKSASEYSKQITCSTGESVPLVAANLNITTVSTTIADLSWKPLTPKEARGYVIECKVQWHHVNQSSNNVDHVSGNTTTYTITGLFPGQRYRARVSCATSKGWSSDDLPWTEFEMPVSLIPPAPNLHLFIFNANSIQVQWSYKWRHQTLEGFKLSCKKKDSSAVQISKNLRAHERQFVFESLEPQTWYEVSINAITTAGNGEEIVRSIRTFPPEMENSFSVPDIPVPFDLEAKPMSATSITLTWTPPTNGNVSFYTIAYQIVQSTPSEYEGTPSYASSTSNEIELKNLKPFTTYEMKVRAHDYMNGHSVYSSKLEVKTKSEVLGKVQGIEWVILNKSSIRLSWRKPSIVHGAILNYIISYTRDPTVTWKNITVPGNTLSAEVTELIPNVPYFLRIQGETSAGIGAYSEMIPMTITAFNSGPLSSNSQQYPPHQSPTVTPADQVLGIVVGCSIGICCIALCTATLVLRRQCGKPHSRCSNNNGPIRDSTNGFYHEHIVGSERHEMQCLAQHIDSKGGYPNGPLNGLRLLRSNCIPNGPFTSIRITENPHFIQEFDCNRGEGDSLLSGVLNETQLTTLGLRGEGSEDREEGGDSGLGNDRTESDHGLDGYRFSQTESDYDGCRLNSDSCKSVRIELDEDSNQNNTPCSYYRFDSYKRPCSPRIKKYSDPPADDGFCENHCVSHYPTPHLTSSVGSES